MILGECLSWGGGGRTREGTAHEQSKQEMAGAGSPVDKGAP